jgi:MAF protein
MRVVLASSSPRRRELLARITFPFDVVPADIEESRRVGEAPDTLASRLAAEKATRVSTDHRDAAVLAADTIVVLGDEVLGKPADERDAERMLARLAGREHEVLTAIAWARDGALRQTALSRSRVRFRHLSAREIADYVATGEPADKAGAYAIQAGASSFVRAVDGSTTGVIGLPISETAELARRLGVPEPLGPLPAEAVVLRYRAICAEVAGLAVGCGRQAEEVRVVAVGKGQPGSLLAAAVEAGARDLGENYVQEAAEKRAALPGAAVRWHMIGRLQRNKAAIAARTFSLVHTVDRVAIGRALAERCPAPPVRVLLQVNVTRDPAKAGALPEDVPALVAELTAITGLSLEGLMTIGPVTKGESLARAAFDELRASLDALRAVGYERLRELSMGMSGDYAPAVAAGATLLRIGTAIFGSRPAPGKRA